MNFLSPFQVRRPAWIALAWLLAIDSPALWAADGNPPERISYQGYLVDANGVAVGNTAPKNYDVVFRIYDAQAQGVGNRLWTEQQTVTIDKGYYSVQLGEGGEVAGESRPPLSSVFSGSTASDRFVQTTVKGIGTGGADVTIQPRLRLLPAPYAFMARSLGSPSGTLLTVSNNNLGIGTTAPILTLDVRGPIGLENSIGNAAARPSITNSPFQGEINGIGSAGGSSPSLGAWDGFLRLSAGSGGYKSFLDLSGYSTVPDMDRTIVLGTAGTERMRIDASGNVGFGSTLSVLANGKVGIGTASPSFTLDLRGSQGIVSGVGNNALRPAVGTNRIAGELAGVGTFPGADDGFLRLSAGGGSTRFAKSFIDLSGFSVVPEMYNNLVFGTAGTERMRIDGSGKVGIGTATPDHLLTLMGNYSMNTYGYYRSLGGNSWGYLYGSYAGLGDGFHLGYNYYYAPNGAGVCHAPQGGTSRLTVGYGRIDLAAGNPNTAPGTVMSVNANGCVGIGPAYTWAPPTRLSVDGNIVTTGSYWMNRGGSLYQLHAYGGGLSADFVGAEWWGPNVNGSSDKRMKNDIATLDHSLEKLMHLRGVTFHWNELAAERFTKDIPDRILAGSGKPEDSRELWEEGTRKARAKLAEPQIGFIAQEVEEVFPEWVRTDSDGYKRIDMKQLDAVIVNAIKEQQGQIQQQQNDIDTLKRENEEMRRSLGALEALVKAALEQAEPR